MTGVRRIDGEVTVTRAAQGPGGGVLGVVLGGALPDVLVPGLVLEGAVGIGAEGWLVLTTDDCPFEEGLHILWIDRRGRIAGREDRGMMYCAGICTDVAATGAGIRFAFPEPGTQWEARVTPGLPGRRKLVVTRV